MLHFLFDFAKVVIICTIELSFLHKHYLNTIFNRESGLV